MARTESAYRRAIAALGRALMSTKPGLTLTRSGAVSHWSENLLPGIDPGWFEPELNEGDGRELEGKFKAAHSSSALAVNTFARFKTAPPLLQFASCLGCDSFRFEAKCSAGVKRRPPNLDLLLQSPDQVVGIESKCTEHLTKHIPKFAPAYNEQIKDARRNSAWFRLMQRLLVQPALYCHLDAAQLIKHAYGLAHCFPDRVVKLVYVYWEPRNAVDFPEFARHRNEVTSFANDVAGASLSFEALSYHDLWDAWDRLESPPWLREHVTALRARYDMAI